MRRSALILCIGIVAMVCFACVPPPPPPPPTLPPSFSCDAQPFLAKVSVLNLPFDVKGPNRSVPTSNRPVDPNSNIYSDLGKAYCIAPPEIKQDLLSLDGIYINPCTDSASCNVPDAPACDPNGKSCDLPDQQVIYNSWGYREWRRPAPNYGKRYIAMSAGLWNAGNHAPDLDVYETKLLNQLLFALAFGPDPSNWPAAAERPQYQSNASILNRPELTVLAALAHELGHVRWYDAYVPVAGGNHDLRRVCNGMFFSSWQGNVPAPPRWRDFGTRAHRHKQGYVQIKAIDDAISAGNFQTADRLLSSGSDGEIGIFAARAPWASFFAAISPDEDFVETYKLYALTKTNPSLSLPVQIPHAGTADVPQALQLSKPELSSKLQCIASLYSVPRPPPASPR